MRRAQINEGYGKTLAHSLCAKCFDAYLQFTHLEEAKLLFPFD
jgi:hypothetical protein